MKPSCNGWGLPKAHSKDELLKLVKQALSLQPDCSVIDLDLPSNQHACPPDSDLGVWVDTWHLFVDTLGSSEEAEIGIRAARLFLFEISTKCVSMIFSADASKPPLDQFGSPGKCLELLFNESSCYTNIRPIAIYRGRKIYLGTEPSRTKSYIP